MHGIREQLIAERLYDAMDRIEAEAGQAGQVAQDAEADRQTWVRIVADFIADGFGERQAACWYEQWRPERARGK